ncbi:hypothetical protein ACWCQP_43670 [Streptomyces chartreusis]
MRTSFQFLARSFGDVSSVYVVQEFRELKPVVAVSRIGGCVARTPLCQFGTVLVAQPLTVAVLLLPFELLSLHSCNGPLGENRCKYGSRYANNRREQGDRATLHASPNCSNHNVADLARAV